MANYLPVLLVSVAANSIPDDSSVSTLPRGQVDYLSHNWEEEDVWRSWRNMTRQKNEITNGVRLENASWRTWWKQRNGLGTVTPETLNWLKDSDVTWLYGPLHTAVDWTPPPKPIPEPASALDLSTTHKPILKHRSISQLLTSDLPAAPHLSPPQSDADVDLNDFEPTHPDPNPPRPPLTHTKSDTHITRWGPSRTFRKESPPRIDPPAAAYSPTSLDAFFASSSTSSAGADNTPTARAPSPAAAGGQQKKRHISFNTFVEQCIAIEKPKNRVPYDDDGDDEDDDDEDEDAPQGGRYPYGGRNPWGYDDGYEEDEEADSGDDDEEEAVSLSMWDERYGGSAIANSDSDSYDGRDDDDEPIEEEEEDDVDPSLRRSPFRASTNSARSQSKVSTTSSSSSTSTSTTLSSSTSASSASTSDSRDRDRERRLSTSTTSTYRPRITQPRRRRAPPLIRTATTERERELQPLQTHVTIAPIAPTILKAGGGYSYAGGGGGEWAEGFGDEAGGSDDGLWGAVMGGVGVGGRWWSGVQANQKQEEGVGAEREDKESGTPVELVYVPPFGSNYSVRLGRDREREREREREYAVRREVEELEDGLGSGPRGVCRSASDQGVYRGGEVQGVYGGGGGGRAESGPGPRRKRSLFSVGVAGDDEVDPDADAEPAGVIPTVVVPREDAYDYFEGPDMGELFPPGRGRRARGRQSSESFGSLGDRSRSRSKSQSRTPSPAVSPSTSIDGVTCVPTPPAPTTPSTSTSASASTSTSTTAPVAVPGLRRSASASPPVTASALLAPPPRGRGSTSHQDLQQAQGRGRSSTRTASTGSLSAAGSSSSLGSLSPEGIVAGVGAGREVRSDRGRDRDSDSGRGRDRGRDGGGGRESSRGRDRTGKRLSTSLSPDDLLLPPPSMPAVQPQRELPRLNIVTGTNTSAGPSSSSSASSTSSAATIKPRAYTSVPEPISIPVAVEEAEKEKQRHLQPTPSNSPVIAMHAPTSMGKGVLVPSTPTTKHAAKARSPLSVPSPPHPAEPSTSYSVSPPPSPSPSPHMSSSGWSPASQASGVSSPPSSPRSPTRGDATIVGKAVGMVSSAGAFLGLWNGPP